MEALGIDIKLLIAQIVNFGILFFLLSKFLYKPITGMLDERRKKVEQSLKDSDAATLQLEKAQSEAEKIREKAYGEANEILKNGKIAASSEATEIVKKASDQADRILANAKSEAENLKKNALMEARSEITSVVGLALDKIVESKLSTDEKSKLAKSSLAEL